MKNYQYPFKYTQMQEIQRRKITCILQHIKIIAQIFRIASKNKVYGEFQCYTYLQNHLWELHEETVPCYFS